VYLPPAWVALRGGPERSAGGPKATSGVPSSAKAYSRALADHSRFSIGRQRAAFSHEATRAEGA